MSYLAILLMSLQNYFTLSNKCIRVYSMDVPDFFRYMKTVSAILLLQITLCIHVYILPCTSMSVSVGWIPRSRIGPKGACLFYFANSTKLPSLQVFNNLHPILSNIWGLFTVKLLCEEGWIAQYVNSACAKCTSIVKAFKNDQKKKF